MSAAEKVIAWHKECLAQRNLPGAQRAGVSAGAAFCLVQTSLADPRAHSAAQPPHALQGAFGALPRMLSPPALCWEGGSTRALHLQCQQLPSSGGFDFSKLSTGIRLCPFAGSSLLVAW